MHEVTQILTSIRQGEANAVEGLLPLVYGELRRLASIRLSREAPGLTLQATALVHEAYVRLVDVDHPQSWNDRGHFFAAAAEAMRRILVENARHKLSLKQGGKFQRQDVELALLESPIPDARLLALDEALSQLSKLDRLKADLVQLRFFGGLTNDEAAAQLGISSASAERLWSFARAWLFRKMSE